MGTRAANPGQQSRFDVACAGGRLDDAIVAYVEDYDYVTIVELQRRLEHAFSVRGDKVLTILHPSIILWSGMSDVFCDALTRLLDEKRVMPVPASYFTYLIDGGALRLPLAARMPKKGYKKDHWLPICLRPAGSPPEYRAPKRARGGNA